VLYTPLCIFAMMSVISANFMNFLIKMRGWPMESRKTCQASDYNEWTILKEINYHYHHLKAVTLFFKKKSLRHHVSSLWVSNSVRYTMYLCTVMKNNTTMMMQRKLYKINQLYGIAYKFHH
jgi:hypothetical protein